MANIEVASSIDLSEKSAEELTFEEYKTIDIKEGVTIRLGQTNCLTAEKGLTLTGKVRSTTRPRITAIWVTVTRNH